MRRGKGGRPTRVADVGFVATDDICGIHIAGCIGSI